MTPISLEEALSHTDPSGSDEERLGQAKAIQAGVAANDIYWSHADPLEALKARAEGHGVVVSAHADDAALAPPADAEATAVDEPDTPPPAEVPAGAETPPAPPAETPPAPPAETPPAPPAPPEGS